MLSEGKGIENIDPASISGIVIWKDAPAVALYGEMAKDGVVQVTTNTKSITDDSISVAASKIQIANIKEIKGMIIVDGVETSKENLYAIDQKVIKSIKVLKNNAATTLYGEKGKDGVIIVTTKKAL